MKLLYTFLFVIVFHFGGEAQTPTTQQVKYFAQVQLNTNDSQTLDAIENAIKNNPNCFVVRLDRITNGLLIVTNDLSSFTQDDLISWMEGNEAAIECSTIGIQGYDDHLPFDENFCEQVNQ